MCLLKPSGVELAPICLKSSYFPFDLQVIFSHCSIVPFCFIACCCSFAIFVVQRMGSDLPGSGDFRHFISRLALLLNLLTSFWLVACLFLPAPGRCFELLNCCCRIAAAICLGESSSHWAWVATKAGQLSMLYAAKRVERAKLAVVGITTMTSPLLTAPSATSD